MTVPFEVLTGETLVAVDGMNPTSELITLATQSGRKFEMFHAQDCCEQVAVQDVCGDIQDIIDTPILSAYETTSENASGNDPGRLDSYDESYTWTFYRITTVKGQVVIRWYGTSNGYYSESVDFVEVGR